MVSFRASRGPLFIKAVSWLGLFLPFLTANWLQLLFEPITDQKTKIDKSNLLDTIGLFESLCSPSHCALTQARYSTARICLQCAQRNRRLSAAQRWQYQRGTSAAPQRRCHTRRRTVQCFVLMWHNQFIIISDSSRVFCCLVFSRNFKKVWLEDAKLLFGLFILGRSSRPLYFFK